MSKKYDEVFKSKIIRLHLEESRTQKSLSAEYGPGNGTLHAWIKRYRKECATNSTMKVEHDIYIENAKLRAELAESKKEVLFLKKAAAFFAKEIDYCNIGLSRNMAANLARKTTGFSEEDLSLLWEAIVNMFEHDHAAARGKMAVRELIVFKHDSELGNAPAHKLFGTVQVSRKDALAPPRRYSDYEVTISEGDVPQGVSLSRMV